MKREELKYWCIQTIKAVATGVLFVLLVVMVEAITA